VKQIALCGWCIIVSPLFGSESGSKNLVNDLVKHWQTSESLSLAIADAMPGEAYRPFKPSDSEWNFADEMGGLALVNVLSCSLAFHTRAPERFQSAFDRPMDHSKAGTMESLKVAYDYCIDGLTQLNDSELFELAVISGHRTTKFDILWNTISHVTYGLGRADMYLRSKGIKPPDTGPKYEF
jgi:hypothetical protein